MLPFLQFCDWNKSEVVFEERLEVLAKTIQAVHIYDYLLSVIFLIIIIIDLCGWTKSRL